MTAWLKPLSYGKVGIVGAKVYIRHAVLFLQQGLYSF